MLYVFYDAKYISSTNEIMLVNFGIKAYIGGIGMIRNKIGIIVVMLCMVAVVCGQTFIFAANTTDTSFAFVLSSESSKQYTEARAKQDSSSTYIKLSSSPPGAAYFSAYGYIPSGSTGTNVWTNETVGSTKVKITKGEWFLRQNVYEHGGRSEKLLIARYQSDGMVSGKWSPDSVGEYETVN